MQLADIHDGILFDLDGTLITGAKAVPGAVEALGALSSPLMYVTNNASRSPAQTALHLQGFGFQATAADVMTSAEAAVHLLGENITSGARVLVVGHQSFKELVVAAGYRVVSSADEEPDAVLQGLSRELTWSELAEGCLAIRAGALWIASNNDTTLPTDRGLLPGNGSLVAALRAATDRIPVVAGKPAAGMLHAAADRVGSRSPLVVGDRLDTDIAGAVAAGMPSLLVLTGVSRVSDLWHADVDQRPVHVGLGLSALSESSSASAIAEATPPPYRVEGDTLVVMSLREPLVPSSSDTGMATSECGADLRLVRGVLRAGWTAGATRLSAEDQSIRHQLVTAGLPVD